MLEPETTSLILAPYSDLAREHGFDLFAVTSADAPDHGREFSAWLRAGHHAGMAWLRRSQERLLDPRKVLPQARSILCLAASHARPPVSFRGGGRVARYAAQRDYHNVIGRTLRRMVRDLKQRNLATTARAIVDAGPLLERDLAGRAGVGFIGKSTNLLHPVYGPWIFLAEILLDRDLPPTTRSEWAASCGSCSACLEACPTGALIADRQLDARRCISYWTIEHRGFIPVELRPTMGDWVFGCDICSEVCPFGSHAPQGEISFGSHDALDRLSLEDLLTLDDEAFAAAFEGSAIRRCKRAGLLRNAAIALANLGRRSARGTLMHGLNDPDPIVRGHCAWALGRLAPVEARETLGEFLASEEHPRVREELANAISAAQP